MDDAITEQIAQAVRELVKLRELARAQIASGATSFDQTSYLVRMCDTTRLDIDGYEALSLAWRRAAKHK